jgi:hypothetical protein
MRIQHYNPMYPPMEVQVFHGWELANLLTEQNRSAVSSSKHMGMMLFDVALMPPHGTEI